MNNTTKQYYELKAEILQAAGHPIRLAIIDFLAGGEQCVCDIARHVEAERSNVSRHLSVLLKVGILQCRKEGLKVIYRLRATCFPGFLECVSQVLREKVEDNAAVLEQIEREKALSQTDNPH